MSYPSVREQEAGLIERRAQFANGHLTQVTWGLAAAAACSDAPEQFAYIFALLILAMAAAFDWPHRRVYKLWRQAKHPFTRPSLMWRRYSQFLLAWAFLGAVACGFVSTHGLRFFHVAGVA
jgi:hypothetical protein